MLADLDSTQVLGLRVLLVAFVGAAGVVEVVVGAYALSESWNTTAAGVFGSVLLISAALRGGYVCLLRQDKMLEFLSQPCRLRALGACCTGPLQVYLVACFVGISDGATLGLLLCATFVLGVLFFVLEVEHASAETEVAEPLELAGPELGVGMLIAGPRADTTKIAGHRESAVAAWVACMCACAVLHVCVWTVLLARVAAVGGRGVFVLAYGQCACACLLLLVPVLTKGLRWTNAFSVSEQFASVSVIHVMVDVGAKMLLIAAFLLPA